MSKKSPFLGLKKDCREAVGWLSNHLEQSGMQVVQTFDLDDTRVNHRRHSCPQHGTVGCDCEQFRGKMAILFVYANGLPPASIIAQSREGQTWFILVDSPQQSLHSGLAAAIQDALATHIFDLLENPANTSCDHPERCDGKSIVIYEQIEDIKNDSCRQQPERKNDQRRVNWMAK